MGTAERGLMMMIVSVVSHLLGQLQQLLNYLVRVLINSSTIAKGDLYWSSVYFLSRIIIRQWPLPACIHGDM
jgi:hypothetical protein